MTNYLKISRQKGAKNFELKNPVAFDKGVSIAEKSVIGPYAILGKNVTVGKNAQISNSVIFPNVEIGEFASIDGALIGEGARIGKHVKITMRLYNRRPCKNQR